MLSCRLPGPWCTGGAGSQTIFSRDTSWTSRSGVGVERVRVVHAGSPCAPCTRHHPLVPVADPCPAASTRTWTPGGPSQVLPGTRTGSTWTFPTRSLVHGSSHLLPGSYPGKSMYAWSRPGIQVLPGRWKESPRQDRQKVQLQTTYSKVC